MKNNWNHSEINLDLYISKEDLELLRNKKSRKLKNEKNTIITRSYELVKKAKAGDIKARNYLFLLHTPLARYTLNKNFSIHPSEFDDWIAECFFIFLEAIEKFDLKKSNNFIYLYQLCIVNEFKNEYEKKKRHHIPTTEYDETIDKDYEDNIHLLSHDVELLNIEYS
jgi:DNA-directed RNA polymerase specialized sigma subunit